MRFDASVNLGHVLTILALLAGGSVAYTQIKVELAALSIKVEGFHGDFERQERRLNMIEQRLNRLEMSGRTQ